LPFAPSVGQGGIERQGNRHADHGNTLLQHLLRHGLATDADGHHNGHAGHLGDVARELRKVGLANQGAAVFGFPLHGRGLVTAAREFHQIHNAAVEHLNHRLRIGRIKLFKAPTPFIGALVGKRRQKLAQQIPMCSMYLNAVKTGLLRKLCGVGKPGDGVLDLRVAHLLWLCKVKGHCRWCG
jgi:hypothetical protein